MEFKTVLEPQQLETASYNRNKLVEQVRRWGGSSSDAILDPACKIFHINDINGFIGYRVELNCAIVFGDPVCAQFDIPRLTQAFHHYCEEQGWSVIYTIASEQFANWAIKHICKTSIEFGEELILDPHADPRSRTGVNASLVRRKVRHAEHEGVQVREYLTQDTQVENEIEQVGKAWLKSRQGPQVYISHVRLFDDRFGKRWFYAQQGEKIVGTVLLNQLQARQGWLLNHLMMTPDAPHGTPEILVITALDALQQENCSFITFGAVPARQFGEIVGLGKFSTWMTRNLFKVIRKILNLDGRKKFWEKYHPDSARLFLLFDKPRIGLREIFSLMRAMNVSLK